MPNSYLSDDLLSPKQTSQSEPIPGSNQVENSAGGFVYQLDKWSTLQRFLILGTEGGSYYASQRDLTKQNSLNLLACIQEDGLRTVRVITEISVAGRAPKNDQAIYALALASVKGNDETRKAALDALPNVCRIGTHLFMFAEFRDALGGWGRGVQRAVGDWYVQEREQNIEREQAHTDWLALQIIKYRQRGGWSHRDLLRLSKVKGNDYPEVNSLLKYVTKIVTHGELKEGLLEDLFEGNVPRYIEGFEKAQGSPDAKTTAKLVEEYALPREALKTEHLNTPEVWEAMLFHGGKYGMPMTAMIRNLATMTRIGLLTSTSKATQRIVEMLNAGELIKHARVHPMSILFALKTYASGQSVRGSNTWQPIPQIIDALDDAFYMAFDNVEKTGKRKMIALDISGSMWGMYSGSGWVGGVPGFTAAQAAAAMSMVSVKSGDPYETVAFADGTRRYYERGELPGAQLIDGLIGLPLSGKQRLDDVDRLMQQASRFMGATDCALPMLYATEKGREVDVFEILTDNETWAGAIHPSQALVQYRQKSGIDAKLIVVGMTATEFTIADPSDRGMLDVVGFDVSAPSLMASFAKGEL